MAFIIDPDAWYTPQEAEPILGQSRATQAKDRCLGRGCPYTKRGKLILYRGHDLLAALEAGRVRHGAEFRERQREATDASRA